MSKVGVHPAACSPATSGNAATLARLPEQPGQLGHQRRPPSGEPGRDQSQHADERHRIAGADEHPGREPERQTAGRRHQQLAAGHEHGTDDDHAA